ncbi:MAG TPA: long-chain fatty acid--CoA ligase, partial [Chloroflexi bacterium]|nr:long-chain fatty acid--CoA ligase [Chloroflexota bacterium]
MFIGDWLARRAQLTPHKVALIDTLHANRQITYCEWNRSANRTANYLRGQFDIAQGDRVAVLAMNSVAYLDIWFALGKLGGVLQNLNWRLSARELIQLVQDASPKVLLYGGDFLPLIADLRAALPELQFVALDEKENLADSAFETRASFGEAPPPEIELRWSDPWVICYTGGTTGTPKGALLTHQAITANAANTVISWGLTADDVTLLNSPLFHTGGLNVFTAPLVYVGGTSIVTREFELEQTFDLLTGG